MDLNYCKPLASILQDAQGAIDPDTGLPIDIGGHVVELRQICDRLRAELAKANGYINRLRDMLTDANPCIDPSRDACNCILCELVSRDRQQAALDKEEGK